MEWDLESVALQRQCGIEVASEKEIEDLVTLNRLDETLIVKIKGKIAQISALTTRSKARSGVPMGSDPDSLREEVRTGDRADPAIPKWRVMDLIKKYLVGEMRDLTQEDVKWISRSDVYSRRLTGLLRCMYKIWINEIGTNMSNGTPSRSITQEIGSEVKRLST
ncbi:LOW QUALITY PROTEIN: hypothetical protein PHMEG_00041932 [Phytophthora megakarya]|uniref:Reverse transcriptase n=1 Tax=Phytophthora megakarya TaxID=4795 RepID=A0A225UAL5_9STRA|nr:LOW QUALITY PROTEIN: hypothetical protein PHMEG_00041932 [Phytophthora megakarya]